MNSDLWDGLVLLAWTIVVPLVMLSFILGRTLFTIFIVAVIGFIIHGRYKVRQMNIYVEGLKEAARIAAEEIDDSPTP